MNTLRTLIVDDEPLARAQMRRLLENEPDVEILGESGDGNDALRQIRQRSPDLVFLDVRMPRLGGFEVVAALDGQASPLVVFVTAYDEYALSAFEVTAADYLLKPVRRKRLRESLERARRERAAERAKSLQAELLDLLEKRPAPGAGESRLWFRSPGRIISVKSAEIEWVDGAGNYVKIHAAGETHRVRQTLSRLEARLESRRFLRIHRSTIVNVGHIEQIAPYSSGELVLVLRSGQRLTVSRTYRDRLENFHLASVAASRSHH